MGDFQINDGVLVSYKGEGKNVIIPEGVEQIGFFAVFHLEGAISIHLPASLTKLSVVFTRSNLLKAITVDENNPKYKSIDGVLYSKGERTLVRYPPAREDKIFKIKEGVISIGGSAFFGCDKIEEVILPSTIKRIGSTAFSNCYKLEKINLVNGIEKISQSAFERCRSLREATIPLSVDTIGYQAFSGCSSLKKIKIPRTVKKVDANAFSFCLNLKSIEIESEDTVLENKVFEFCNEIENISVPSALIQSYDWWKLQFSPNVCYSYGLENLSKEHPLIKQLTKNKKNSIDKLIEIGRVDLVKPLLEKSAKLKLANVDELIEYVKKYESVELTSVLLDYKRSTYSNEELEKYENDRLDKELGLKELTISDWTRIFRIKSYDGKAMIRRYMGKDTSVVIPEKMGKYAVVEIDPQAFAGCEITSIELPKTITKIGDCAFSGCELLTQIDLPKKIKEIASGLFGGCLSLESVTIPFGVNTIKSFAFFNCKNLKSVIIPSSVKAIEDNAFSGCNKLTIKAPLGSYAEKYAQDYGIKFEEI
ncbi:MAG: leucine-rich repeat domain-containing protein [Clostridia bacterium]|nr:leucine-rich repeat domain-containing protein [Clostridia bacterium]